MNEFKMIVGGFAIGDITVELATERHRPAQLIRNAYGKQRWASHTMTCRLKHAQGESVGVARCSVKDRYDPMVGARLALARAMASGTAIGMLVEFPREWLRLRASVLENLAHVVALTRVRRPRTLREHHRLALRVLREIVALAEPEHQPECELLRLPKIERIPALPAHPLGGARLADGELPWYQCRCTCTPEPVRRQLEAIRALAIGIEGVAAAARAWTGVK